MVDQEHGPRIKYDQRVTVSRAENVAAHSPNSVQISGDQSIEDLLKFAQAVSQSIPMLGLSVDQTQKLQRIINATEQEAASENPDVSKLRRFGELIKKILAGATGNVLAEVLMRVWPG